MRSAVNIRFGTRGSAEALAELGRETFHDAFADHPLMPKADLDVYLDEAFSVSRIAGELGDSQAVFLLAETDGGGGGGAVGYAKLLAGGTDPNVFAKNPVKLKRLYVRREFVGAGVGAALISRCLDEARKSGHDKIWLTVWEHNRRAQEFYRKWEFKPCGVVDFQLGSTFLTDILMQRSL